MKLANRLVSLLLAAGMTVSFVPVSAFAVDTGGGIFPDTVSTQAENAAELTISEAYFEDEEFRKYICSTLFPGKAEGDPLTAEELESVTAITSPRENITSLQGIEHFPNLEKLIVYSQGLTTLDVRKNTKLTTLDVSGDWLTSIDVSKNTELVSLNVSNNPLTGLDVSNNTKLQQLYCAINGLSSLDLSNNTKLTLLGCPDNDLAALDLSKNPALTYLDCSNNDLSELDLSNNTELTYLDCHTNRLTGLDPSSCKDLQSLLCFSNRLTKLDLSSCKDLQYLLCSSNKLTELDLSGCKDLQYFDCPINQLTHLDLSSNTALVVVNCNKNNLAELDLPNSTLLEELYCNDNSLTELNLSNNTELEILECSNNNLTSLNFATESFVVLDCSNNSRTIGVGKDGTFALSTLPGFEAAKASDWKDGDGNAITVSADGILTVGENVDTVTYFYNCGGRQTAAFALNVHHHTYNDTVWDSNGTSHWHTCTDADCPDKTAHIDEAAHTYDEAGKCTVCGYQHEHTLTDWKHDETSHWKECTADGCFIADHIVERAEHTYDSDTDDTCNVCGFKRTLPEPEPKPEPEEPVKGVITLPEDGGVTVTDKDGNKVTSAAKGDELYLNYDLSQLPEGKLFDGWTVTDKDGNAVEVTKDADGKYHFTMPEGDVKIELKTASINMDPETPAGPTIEEKVSAGAGGVIAGAAMGAAGYVAGTQIYLTAVLPKGTPIPTSRGALAALLWTTAGKPEPATAALYADVSEADAQKADRWCVEQGLLTDKGESFKPEAYVTRVQVIRSWNALQKLLK